MGSRRQAMVAVLLLLWCGAAVAGAAPAYREITAPEVKDMLDRDAALVVHVLSEIEYQMQHIPGSINIPITELETTRFLPQDRARPIVFYCMGLR